MPDNASTSWPPALPPAVSAFLSPHGRMGRLGFWIGVSVAGLILLGAVFLLARASDPKGSGGGDGLVVALMLVLLVLVFWVYALVTVKRLRDAGQPGWTWVFYAFGGIAWLALVFAQSDSGAVALVGSVAILVLPGFYPSRPDPAAEAEAG